MRKQMKTMMMSALCMATVAAAGAGVASVTGNVETAKADATQLVIAGQTLTANNNVNVNYLIPKGSLSKSDVKIKVVEKETDGTETETILSPVAEEPTYTYKGEENVAFYKFVYTGVAANEMANTLYATAYLASDETVTSKTLKYSILDYAFNTLGLTDKAATTDKKTENLVKAILAYGAAAEAFGANLDTPVDYTEEYTYVSVTNATLEDGFSSGIYKVGQSIVVTPDLGFGVSAGAVGFVDNGDGTFTYEVPEEKPDLSGAFEDKSSSIDPAVKIADVVEALTLNFTAMKVGDEQTLPAFIAEVWEDEVSISWSIADDSIAVGSIEDNVLSFTEAGDATLVATIACEGAESVEVTFGINVDDSDETKLNNALAALNLDFTEVELGAEKTLPTSISGHEVTVAWEVSNATLSDDNTVTFNATGTAILTAKITYNKISVHKPFEITVTGAVSAEQAYFLFGESGGKTYYVAGTGNQRLTATTNMDEALAIYFEYDSGDNYYIYFKEGEAKTYIGHSSSTNLTFGEKAAATTWTMDTIEEKFMSTASGATDRWLGINTSTSPVCVRPYNTDTYKPVYFMEAKELTPEYKIDQEIAALQTEYSINGGEKVNLPVKGETYKDVTISWELVGNYDFVESLVDGELVTTNPSEDATVTLKATLKCGEESKIFEGIVVTVKYVNASVPAEPIGAKTYTFSSYPNGTQYAQGEKHALDSDVTLTINGAHLNGEVRLYAGSNAVLSIPSANKVFAGTFTVNAGNKAGTLTISASVDGTTWVKLDAVTTTSSYKDYSVTVDQAAGYKYLKMESAGAQIRVKNVKFA